MIGDPSHHGRRRDITQKMNNEDLDSDGGGANVGAHRIHDRGIQWRGIQQQEESRNRNRRHHHPSLEKQGHNHHRNAEGHADGRHQVVGAFHSPQQIVAQPSARQGRYNPIDHDDDAENEIRVGERVMALAVKKLRHPHLNPAQRKCHGRHSESRRQERRVAQNPGIDALQIQVRRRVKPCQETASKNSRR